MTDIIHIYEHNIILKLQVDNIISIPRNIYY